MNRLQKYLHVLAFLIWISVSAPTVGANDADRFTKRIAPALKQHCAECHGANEEIEGDVNLRDLTSASLRQDVELVDDLINVLDLGEMPPEGSPQLTVELRDQLVSDLNAILRDTIAANKAYARVPIRRMNRFQYNNAVTDLFDLNCIVFTLPERMMRVHKDYFKPETGKMADVVYVGSRPLGKSQMIEQRLSGVAAFPQDLRAEHGYDNRGDHLSLSPLLMESFLKLGHSIVESPDFTPQRVGIWKAFFEPPQNAAGRNEIVRDRLKPFLSRAFRRPVDNKLLDRYVAYVHRLLDNGVAFQDAMKSVAAATIASPRFLYLYDTTSNYDTTSEDGVANRVDDIELASRMSFLLWGSIPDQTLLDLAATGHLTKPEILDQQFDRMLKDRKLKRFCDSFPTQWLQLERIISSVPNRDKYPGFYFAKYRDSMHMMLEPLLLFETVLIENLPITQLIDPDFTYRSAKLEKAYGELGNEPPPKKGGDVTVLTFHRVPTKDRRTGGVITNAAVMTMTSGPDHTQPITRGAWVAGVIFNNPPEPPPADVPALDEKPPAGEENLTLRERLAMHRQRSDCKGCHEKIDPLGFALENYDPVGRWRESYDNDREVDVADSLFRKHEFKDIGEFKDAILIEKDRLTRAIAGHLLSFALARELDAVDQTALDNITEATAADGYRIQTLLKQVILSEPFQTKTNPKQP